MNTAMIVYLVVGLLFGVVGVSGLERDLRDERLAKVYAVRREFVTTYRIGFLVVAVMTFVYAVLAWPVELVRIFVAVSPK